MSGTTKLCHRCGARAEIRITGTAVCGVHVDPYAAMANGLEDKGSEVRMDLDDNPEQVCVNGACISEAINDYLEMDISARIEWMVHAS